MIIRNTCKLAFVLSLSFVCQGSIIPVSQTRSVQASGSITSQGNTVASDFEAFSSSDFLPYIASAGVALSYNQNSVSANVNGRAAINSVLGPNNILTVEFLSDMSADAADFELFDTLASGSASAVYDFIFQISTPRLYRLTTSIPLVFDSGSASLTFFQGNTVLAETSAFDSGEMLDLVFQLQPGLDYRIQASTSASAFAFPDEFRAGRGELTFELVETVPEPSAFALVLSGLAVAFFVIRRRSNQDRV